MMGGFDIGLSLSGAPIFFIFLAVLCAGWSWWIYHHTRPPVSSGVRFVLIFLRSVALIFILLQFFSPVLHVSNHTEEPAGVAVLVDNSASMTIEDGGSSRAEILTNLLRSDVWLDVSDRVSMRFYRFSDTLEALPDFDPNALILDGRATDLGGALAALEGSAISGAVEAVLVLSDGAQNSGTDPIIAAQNLGIPVHAVTFGEEQQKSDVVLVDVLANDVTYVQHVVPVEVTVRGDGFSGQRIGVRLMQDGVAIDEKVVVLPSDGLETTVQLSLVPDQPGYIPFTVETDVLKGELTSANNQQQWTLRVLERKRNVLLLSAAPSPDHATLVRILTSDEDIQLQVRTQKKGGGFYEGPFPSADVFRTIDVCILLDLPDLATSSDMLSQLTRQVKDRKLPLLVLAGNRVDVEKLSSLGQAVPFDCPRRSSEMAILPRLTAAGSIHPVLHIQSSNQVGESAWNQLPPALSVWRFASAHPGARILASAQAVGSDAENVHSRPPLILAYDIGDVKSMALLAHNFFRWDLLMRGVGQSNDALRGLFQNAIRWLAVRESRGPVRLTASKPVIRAGEHVVLTAQVYDETVMPLSDADVTVVGTALTDTFSIPLHAVGSGRYRGSLRLLSAGTYAIRADATIRGEFLGSDTATVVVSAFNPEFLNTRSDPQLLEAMAQISGGIAGPPDSLSVVASVLNFPMRSNLHTRDIHLTHLPTVLAVIAFLLSVEWFIRKRKGML